MLKPTSQAAPDYSALPWEATIRPHCISRCASWPPGAANYSGHLALGSKLMMVCGGAVGTIGRRYGLPDALWHE
jgi:hypothetical protein